MVDIRYMCMKCRHIRFLGNMTIKEYIAGCQICGSNFCIILRAHEETREEEKE